MSLILICCSDRISIHRHWFERVNYFKVYMNGIFIYRTLSISDAISWTWNCMKINEGLRWRTWKPPFRFISLFPPIYWTDWVPQIFGSTSVLNRLPHEQEYLQRTTVMHLLFFDRDFSNEKSIYLMIFYCIIYMNSAKTRNI